MVRGKPHELQKLRHPLRAFLRRLPNPVDEEGLGDNVPHGHPRVQRAEGVLEDDLHPAPEGPELLPGKLRDVLPVKENPTPVGSISRRSVRPTVVFPLPDSPTSPSTSPSGWRRTPRPPPSRSPPPGKAPRPGWGSASSGPAPPRGRRSCSRPYPLADLPPAHAPHPAALPASSKGGTSRSHTPST